MSRNLLLYAALVFWCAPVAAQDVRQASAGPPKPPPKAITAISPIFGQLVMFSMPLQFRVVHEDGNAQRYIREAVPAGETVTTWTQMITVTGAKGLAGNASVTPQSFAENIAGGFKKACPDTFAGQVLGDTTVSGHPAIIAVVSCGNVRSGGPARSETALLIVIKGATDYYTLQWAEREQATGAPKIDPEKWKARVGALQPVRLCPIVRGEAAPFPSCVSR